MSSDKLAGDRQCLAGRPRQAERVSRTSVGWRAPMSWTRLRAAIRIVAYFWRLGSSCNTHCRSSRPSEAYVSFRGARVKGWPKGVPTNDQSENRSRQPDRR
jgi:hypothetical protein